MFSCGSDDDESEEICNQTSSYGQAGVSQTGFQIESLTITGNRGYLITASIINVNQESVSGIPSFVLKINGLTTTYATTNNASSTSCLDIIPDSSCDFELMVEIHDEDEFIDPNPEFLCFYYGR